MVKASDSRHVRMSQDAWESWQTIAQRLGVSRNKAIAQFGKCELREISPGEWALIWEEQCSQQ